MLGVNFTWNGRKHEFPVLVSAYVVFGIIWMFQVFISTVTTHSLMTGVAVKIGITPTSLTVHVMLRHSNIRNARYVWSWGKKLDIAISIIIVNTI